MSKATIANLKDLGFDAKQFGNPGDWDTADTGYLQRVLDEVATFVSDQVGSSAYDAASGATLVNITQAEKYFSAAELWRRIENFERATARVNRSGDGAETVSSRAHKNAEINQEIAWTALGRVTGHALGSPFAQTVVESGQYESLQ